MFCEVFSPGPCSPPARKLARFARCGRFAAAAAASRPLRPLRGRRVARKKSCLNYPVNSSSQVSLGCWIAPFLAIVFSKSDFLHAPHPLRLDGSMRVFRRWACPGPHLLLAWMWASVALSICFWNSAEAYSIGATPWVHHMSAK